MKYFNRIGFSAILIFIVFSNCTRKPELSNYGIRLQVNGSGITQISFHSKQNTFDVANVPTHEWAVDHSYHGNDTLILNGTQVTDPSNLITVSIRVSYPSGQVITYSDSDVTSTQVRVFLPQ